MNRRELPRLHVITDTLLQTRWAAAELARLVVAGGADAVQFRDKRGLGEAEALEQLLAIRAAIGPEITLIVNDRLKLAGTRDERGRSIADGVHLGRGDAPVALARDRLGTAAWIGRTANDLAEAVAVAGESVDYLGVGPVFGTRSKANPAPRLGLAGLRAIVEEVGLPVIAIGGIGARQVGEVMATGCHGIAVLSDVVCAPDPQAAAARFRAALAQAVAGMPDGR